MIYVHKQRQGLNSNRERMFKKRIAEWKLNKNYKAAEKETIARIAMSFESRGTSMPQMVIRGQPIKLDRVRRFCAQRRMPGASALRGLHQTAAPTYPGRLEGATAMSPAPKERYPLAASIRSQHLPQGRVEHAGEVQLQSFKSETPRSRNTIRPISAPLGSSNSELVLFQTRIFAEVQMESWSWISKFKSEYELVRRWSLPARRSD